MKTKRVCLLSSLFRLKIISYLLVIKISSTKRQRAPLTTNKMYNNTMLYMQYAIYNSHKGGARLFIQHHSDTRSFKVLYRGMEIHLKYDMKNVFAFKRQ